MLRENRNKRSMKKGDNNESTNRKQKHFDIVT